MSLNYKLNPAPVEENPKFVYRMLSKRERDDNKCVVILANKMQCNRSGEALVLKCPKDFFIEVKSQIICPRHLALIKAAALRYKVEMEELPATPPRTAPKIGVAKV